MSIKTVADYDMANQSFVKMKENVLSEVIVYSEEVGSATSIEKSLVGVVDGIRVINNIPLKSAYKAENFVTRTSTNKLSTWKN